MKKNSCVEKNICMFIIISFTIIAVFLLYRNATRQVYVYLTKGSRDTAEEISRDNSILQEVPYHAGNFGYSFLFTTYGHKVSGEVTIQAVGKASGFMYVNQTIPGRKFKNNEFVDFLIPDICPSDDETIIFTFSSNSDPTSGLTLLITDDDSMPGYESLFNGNPMYTDIVTRVITPSRGAILSLILIIVVIIVSYISLYLLCLGPLQIQRLLFVIFSSLLFFLLFVSLLTLNIRDPFFDTDEGEIFINGKGIAYGYNLYTDLHSQHMPFSYYFSALFWKLGANSFYRQRFAFYCFFALMWTIIIKRYENTVSKFTLILYPFLFMISIKQYSWGTTILSEHLAGIGFVILLLEIFHFCRTETLRVDNSLFLSLSIVLTFGTIFIAAYAIFAVAVLIFIKEIVIIKKRNFAKKQISERVKRLWIPFLGIVLMPWLVLFSFYLIRGTLSKSFYYAYSFNREIYSKYLGGYGQNIFSAGLQGFSNIKNMICNLYVYNAMDIYTKFRYLLTILALLTIPHYAVKKQYCRSVACLLLLFFTPLRGIWGFHSTQWIAIISLLASCFLVELFDFHDIKWKGWLRIIKGSFAVGCLTFFMFFSIDARYFYLKSVDLNPIRQKYLSTKAMILNSITEPGEAVWNFSFANNYLFIESDAIEYKAINVPWFVESEIDDFLTKPLDELTRVVVLNENVNVSGHEFNKYGEAIIERIHQNYTNLYEDIYVKNDFYSVASEKITKTGLVDLKGL